LPEARERLRRIRQSLEVSELARAMPKTNLALQSVNELDAQRQVGINLLVSIK